MQLINFVLMKIRFTLGYTSLINSYVNILFLLGTLHPGDEIREINGTNVAGQSVENLQAMLVSHTYIPERFIRTRLLFGFEK